MAALRTKRTRCARFLCLALGASLIAACGGQSGESAPDPRTPPAPEAAANGRTSAAPEAPEAMEESRAGTPGTEQVATPPAPRERNFQSRAFDFGAWYGDLRERVSPAKDGWPTEVIAQVAERDLARALGAALEGDLAPWGEVLDAGFRGIGELRPEELEDQRADGVLWVASGVPGKGPVLAAPEWPQAVARLVAPLTGGVEKQVELWVTRSLELDAQRFECTVLVRLVAQLGEGSRQLNLGWNTIWRLDPGRKRVVLMELRPESFEEVVYRKRPFEELTQAVFSDRAFFARDVQRGAVEYTDRYDRTVGNASVYLGMHGLAVGDLDGDGLEDLYVGQQAGTPNRLLMHQPDGTVRDTALEGRVDFLEDTAGVLIADLDGDGARDLALGMGPNVLLAFNDGSGTFPGRLVLQGPGQEQVYSLSAADADGDGDIDLYATRYVAGGVSRGLPTPYHDAENGATNLFWRNEGARSFTLATDEVGLGQNNTRFSLSAIWEDVDLDGDLDLYVANDFGRNNLYRNDGGTFTDIAGDVGAFDMAAGMGVTCADVEHDGDLDLYISNMFTAAGSRIAGHPNFQAARHLDARGGYMHHTQGNTLLLNQGGGVYRDSAGRSRSGPGGWAWGAMFTDFDNDGLPDIVVPNGFLTNRRPEDLEGFFWRCVVNASPTALPITTEYQNAWITISNLGQVDGYSWNGREPNYAYSNLGAGLFADVSGASGLDYRDDARVACVVDWDSDGRQDLWLKNRTAPLLRFVRNVDVGASHWIAVELEGQGANREAVGALVTVAVDGAAPRSQRSYLGHGYLGSSSRRLHFGLGKAQGPAQVTVAWPDGTREVWEGLALGSLWQLRRGEREARAVPARPSVLDRLVARRVPERLPEHPERWIDGNGPRNTRVPLLDRLPLRELELPTFEGRPGSGTTIEGFAGRCLLLLLWGSWDEGSVTTLRSLSGGLAGTDVALYPLSLDAVRDEAFALSVLEASGANPIGGRVDARLQLLLEMVLFEVLGPFDDQPLPLGLLFDPEGSLSVLYLSSLDPAQIVEDARLAASGLGLPTSRWPVALTGGRWAFGRGPSRALENLRLFLRKQGFREVVAGLRAEEARRAE